MGPASLRRPSSAVLTARARAGRVRRFRPMAGVAFHPGGRWGVALRDVGLRVTVSRFASARAAGLSTRSRRRVGVCLPRGAVGAWSVGSDGSRGAAALMPGEVVRRWSVAWFGARTRGGRLGLVAGLLACALLWWLAAPPAVDRDVASGRQSAG